MRMSRSAVLALLPLLAVCAHSSAARERVMSPRELNDDPARHHDTIVVVRGYVTLVPEAHNLYQSQALKAEFERRWDAGGAAFDAKDYQVDCLTITNPVALADRWSELNGKTITVRGRFIANYLEGRVDTGACPLPMAVVILSEDLERRYPAPVAD